mmetsp:Transcript_8651/g.20423  ORF Transcript_8651/g.20423 Transcript_8651/m.20423 type:complete len:80 (+) Transcript_8651:83-322(+)
MLGWKGLCPCCAESVVLAWGGAQAAMRGSDFGEAGFTQAVADSVASGGAVAVALCRAEVVQVLVFVSPSEFVSVLGVWL